MNLIERVTLGGAPYDAAPLTIWQLKAALPHLRTEKRSFAVVAVIVGSLTRARPEIGVAVVHGAIRGATADEANETLDSIMRLSGFEPEGCPGPPAERDAAFGRVSIGGREFILGAIPTEQLQAIIDHRAPGEESPPAELLDLYVRDVYAALAPNNEEVSIEFLEHNLDIPTAQRIIWNIRGQIDLHLPRGRA